MGRKKMAKTKTDEKPEIRLRVDGAFLQRIQEAADQESNSVASFVRSALLRELKRREKEDAS